MFRNSVLIVAVFYLATFCFIKPLQAKEINKTFPKKESVQLKSILGGCEVIKSNDDKIHITLKYSFKDEEFQTNFSESSENLSMEEKFLVKDPKGTSFWTIAIPDNIKMNISSGTGNISIEGVKSEIKVETGTGFITIKEGESILNISTGTGSIEVNKSNGKFELASGMGSLNISDIKIDGVSKFSSGMGGVNIKLSSSPMYDISASSGFGEVTVNYNGNPLIGCFEFTAKQDQGRISSPVKFEKEESYSDDHFQYDKKSFRIDGQNTPKIKIDTGSGMAKLLK
jgi:Putative adhesin